MNKKKSVNSDFDVDHVDLPPSPRIFDKNNEILGCETYILLLSEGQGRD